MCQVLFRLFPPVLTPVLEIPVPLHKREDLALDTGTLEIGGNRLDDQRIFRQLNWLLIDLPGSKGTRRQEGMVMCPQCLLGLLTFSGASQPGDPVVLIRLANHLPKPVFNDRPEESTRIRLGDSESVGDSGVEVNLVRLYVPEMPMLDRLLSEFFTSCVIEEVFRLDVRPGGCCWVLGLISTRFRGLRGQFLVIINLFDNWLRVLGTAEMPHINHRVDTMLVRWFPERAAVGKLLFHY